MNEQLERFLTRAESLVVRLEATLPQALTAPEWDNAVAFRYRKRSINHGVLEPVRHIAELRFSDLKEIDGQKEKIARNTQQFVAGKTANNVLLTGARGTGKSSLMGSKRCVPGPDRTAGKPSRQPLWPAETPGPQRALAVLWP